MLFYILAWKRGLDFFGRSPRKEFWMFMLWHLVLTFACIGLDVLFSDSISFDLLYSVLSAVPLVAIVIRRLHDIDYSGWWICLMFLPAIGIIWLLYLLSLPTSSHRQEVAL